MNILTVCEFVECIEFVDDFLGKMRDNSKTVRDTAFDTKEFFVELEEADRMSYCKGYIVCNPRGEKWVITL